MSKQIERMWFAKVLRMSRRPLKVWLENDKKPTEVWIRYTLSRDLVNRGQR